MEEIDKEISEMKISLNSRARIVAEEFLKNVRISITSYILWSLSLSFSSKYYSGCSYLYDVTTYTCLETILSFSSCHNH